MFKGFKRSFYTLVGAVRHVVWHYAQVHSGSTDQWRQQLCETKVFNAVMLRSPKEEVAPTRSNDVQRQFKLKMLVEGRRVWVQDVVAVWDHVSQSGGECRGLGPPKELSFHFV